MARYEYRADRKSRPHRVRWSVGRGPERRQLSRSFDRKRDALQFKAQLESRGTAHDVDRRTVEEAARDWVLANWETWSPNRRESVDGELRRHVLPIIGDVKVSRLDRRHVTNVLRARREGHTSQVLMQALITDPADHTLSPRKAYPPVGAASERKTMSILGSLLRWLVEVEDALERSPARGVKVRPLSNATKFGSATKVTDADLADPAAVQRICEEIAKSHPDLVLPVMLIAYLGLRPGETFGLRITDVVLSPVSGGQAHLSVAKTLGETPGRFTDSGRRGGFKDTKNYSHRDVPLSVELVKRLRAHLRKTRKRPEGSDREALFVRPDGRAVTAEWYRKAVLNPARQQAGVGDDARTTLRGLRHLGVTVWLRAFDGDAATASRVTGHKPDVLLNVYSGIVDAFRTEGAQAHSHAMDTLGIRI